MWLTVFTRTWGAMSDLKPLLEVFLNSAFTSSSFSSKALHKLSLFIYPVPSLHHDTSWSPRNTFLQKCNRNGGSTVLWWVNLVLPLINDLSPANKSWQGFGKVHLMNETLALKILYLLKCEELSCHWAHIEIRGQFAGVVPLGSTSFHPVGPRNQTSGSMGRAFTP